VTFTWDGPSKDGKAHGMGTAIKYKNGIYESTYVGEYRNGIREGKGKFTHMDGSTKTGTFVAGQLVGRGTMDSENGDSYEGEFINYRLHGKGKARLGNGSTFDGFWVSDAPYTGKFTNYDGSIVLLQAGESVEQINERHTGYTPKIGSRVTEYFDKEWNRCDAKNASFYRIITYSAPHKPKGVVKDYYMSGQLQGEATFVHIDYDDEGKNFIEGKMTTYYRSGKPQSESIYFNNKPNGPHTEYYENGTKKSEIHFYFGVPDGTMTSYYPNGNPNMVSIYDNGSIKNNKYLQFSEDGESCFLVYDEDFNRNRDSWEYNGANGRLVVNNDNTISFTVTPNRNVSGGIYADFSPNGNNIIEISTHQNGLNKDVAIGFLFGFKDWENYCGFYISGNQYTFHQIKNGQKTTNYSWEFSNAIKPDINTLRILNIGNQLGFEINDEDIGSIQRPHYDGGFCAITVINNGLNKAFIDAGGLLIFEAVEDTDAITDYLPSTYENGAGDNWEGSGSGFFIDEKGLLATNYHVIDGANTIEVTFIRNGEVEKYPASVVMSDKQNDLSILKINSPSFVSMPPIPYNFTTTIKDTGSEVFTLGYPIADVMGEEVKFTDGKISSKTGIQGDVTVYQISAPIQSGNSGGPLFDNQGNLVGITSSGLNRDYFKSENVNYAIKSSYLKALIEVLPQNVKLQTQANVASLPLTEKIKKFQPYMVYIKVK
ncbi:trypsin-like peptidase domain-containing protein, partial [Parabacteroides sp. OttesenSCG-928-J18]|nr:trypsin-like peptidase domain-containing protein [Parabacteroides sp. OttesenSCG-928-J18]